MLQEEHPLAQQNNDQPVDLAHLQRYGMQQRRPKHRHVNPWIRRLRQRQEYHQHRQGRRHKDCRPTASSVRCFVIFMYNVWVFVLYCR